MTLPASGRLQRRVAVVLASLAACILIGATPAAAHTELLNVTPGPNQRVVATEPLEISLTFTDAIDPAFANMVLLNSAGDVVATQPAQTEGSNVSQMTRAVVESGTYIVRYRVVSADGHPVDGETGFQVAAPKPVKTATTPTPDHQPGRYAEQPTSLTTASQDEALGDVNGSSEKGDGRGAIAVGAAALVGVVGGAAILLRRRNRSGADAGRS